MANQVHDEFLNPDDLRAFTGTRDVEEQKRVLAAEGVPFIERQRGARKWLVVSRYHVRLRLEGRATPTSRRPNLAAAS